MRYTKKHNTKKKLTDNQTLAAKKTLEKIINRLTLRVLMTIEKERDEMLEELENL